FLAAGDRQRADCRVRLAPLSRAAHLPESRAVVIPFCDRRLLVAAEPVEIAATVYRSPGGAVRRDRPGLLDASDGQARRDPAAGGFRQQHRAATLLSVRAARLRSRSDDWFRAAVSYVCVYFCYLLCSYNLIYFDYVLYFYF